MQVLMGKVAMNTKMRGETAKHITITMAGKVVEKVPAGKAVADEVEMAV